MQKTIAVVGASADRRKYGNKCVRAYQEAGFRVLPVNPRGEPIEGLETYRSLAEVPVDLDRISVYLPPARSREMLAAIAEKGAAEVWFNPGSADSRVLSEAEALGIRVRAGCSIVDIGLSPGMFP